MGNKSISQLGSETLSHVRETGEVESFMTELKVCEDPVTREANHTICGDF